MKYVKPEVFVTEFVTNRTIASKCSYVDPTNPSATTVHCVIGNQEERVFSSGTSGCNSHSSRNGIVVDYNGGEQDYFVWYTGDNDGIRPSEGATQLLNALVRQLGYQAGPGWHYALVDASSTEGFWNETRS